MPRPTLQIPSKSALIPTFECWHYRKQANKKSPLGKRTPKRVKKEHKKVRNHKIEVFTSIKITKPEVEKPKKSPGRKSTKKESLTKEKTTPSKSPVTKVIVRKRSANTPQKPK